ncbi:MAG TPA: tripartite tricarboxylate transporter substrate binding protein [Bradyrhizobium sp.]|uniref:Bug family tripartite tricarboxylate transporter substrate binding protein n=1 Tax=Bradyrhizobium sp. TaxID=376 RepID=UPI002BF78D8E|nr:tripartite tricarboxylate transporter substrate binding protein [Bradyrhizobium sp.]HLZ06796.1 tripartite tricarboxylate transporter substrate binding protein [Bradyrhizobium sp.]
MRKNWALIWLALAAILAAAPAARAADYPSRPIRLIVPYVAGGPTDVLGRYFADYLSRDLKQTVVVENKAGAQGAIGAEAVAHAEPDGYTLLFTASSVIELNPMLYKKLAYDPDRELRVLAVVTNLPSIMVVHPTVPAKTVAEFVAYAKQNPGKLNFGSAGTGGVGHLSGEMFKQMAGIEMTHVPYKGAGPALADLIAGHIQVTFETLGTALPPIKAGLVRPLGVTSAERVPDLPDLPTIAESGYPDYRATVWYGAVAPAGVPAQVVQRIRASIDRALGDEAFREKLTKVGFPPLKPLSEDETKAFVDADRARWSGIVKTLNISLD